MSKFEFDRTFTMRMDNITSDLLIEMSNGLNLHQSDIVRKSVRLFKKISELMDNDDIEIVARNLNTGKEKTIILMTK